MATQMFLGLSSMCLLPGLLVVNAQTVSEDLPLERVERTNYWERGSVRLGAYFPDFNSELGFNVGQGDTLLLDGEDTLDLPSTTTVFRGDALIRLGETRRHQFDVSYAAYRRSGQATLTDPIDLGGGIIIPAIRVDSVLNFDIIRVSYTYALIQSDHVRIGAGLSAYVLPIKYGLDFAEVNTPSVLESRDLLIPVPALALRADFRLWQRLYLTTELNGVYLELLGFRGTLFDGTVGLEYRLWKHLALGVGYSGTLVNVSSTSNEPDYPGASSLGKVDVHFHGALAFVKLAF